MADNKKKKEDLSTSLKRAAERLKPRDLRKDTVTIMIGGAPTPIVRHNMDDETWGNVVRQSIKESTSASAEPGADLKQPFPDRQNQEEVVSVQGDELPGVTLKTTEAEDRATQEEWKAASQVKDVRKKSIDWPRLMAASMSLAQVDKSLVSDEEKELLKGMSEWSRAEFLRERFKKRGYEVPQTTAEAERESYKKEATAEEAPAEKPKGGPSMRNPASFVPEIVKGATGRVTPGQSNEEYIKEYQTSEMVMPQEATEAADIVKGIPSKVGAALQSAAPMEGGFPGASNPAPMEGGFPGVSNPAPVEGGFPGLAGGDAGVAQANAKGEQNAASDLAAIKRLNDAIGNSPLAALNPAVPFQNTASELARLYGPQPEAPDGPPLPGQAIPPGRNPDGTEKIPQHSQPPVAMPPAGGPMSPGSESMRLALSGGGGYTPAQVDPKAKALQAQAQADAIKAQQDARLRIDEEAKNQKAITDKAAEIEVNERQKADLLGALATQSRLEATQKAEQWSAARAEAAAAARDAAANPIDPNRYWNNKTDGQKAFAVIAGALYGFSGQGMQWLQRIDGLVDADNRLQAADRASKVEGLNQYAAEMGAQADDAMKFGLSRAQAHLLARTQKLEGLKSQLDILAMRMKDSVRQQDAMMKSAQLGVHINSIANQGLALGIQEAQMKSHDRYQNAQLAMQRMELGIKAAAAKKGDLDKLDPASLSRLEAIDKALAAAKEARLAIKGKPGDNRLVDQIAKNWVQTLNTLGMEDIAKGIFPETSGRVSAARQGQKTVLKGIMGEAINKEDTADTAPMWGAPGFGNTTGWLDSQEEVLLAEKNAIINNATSAKRDVGTLKTQPSPVRTFTPSK